MYFLFLFSRKMASTSTNSPNESLEQQKFQEELSWCIDYLETNLRTKKLSEKQSKDLVKTISSLKNTKNPLAKKRQVMRISCGDYRAKMAKEEKEFKLSKFIIFNKAVEGLGTI